MPRPESTAGLGGLAVWRLAARAQQAAAPVINRLLHLAVWGPPQGAVRDRIGRGAERGHRVPREGSGRSDSCLRHSMYNHGNHGSRMSVRDRNAGA